jgi:hypothetical protein
VLEAAATAVRTKLRRVEPGAVWVLLAALRLGFDVSNVPINRDSPVESQTGMNIRAFPGLLQDAERGRLPATLLSARCSSFRSQKTIMHKMARRIMKDLQRRESTHFLDR